METVQPIPCRPLRLIHVGLDGTPPRLALGELAVPNDLSGVVEYAALSHCWGTKGLPLRTTRENVSRFSLSIPPDMLPKTFVEALEIARRLQIPYVWIDALCIVQDDNEEWQHESARMDAIYQGSQLTIAAAQSQDCTGGCFPAKESGGFDEGEAFFRAPMGPSDSSQNPGQGVALLVRVYRGYIWLRHAGSILCTRGWTLQEELLSPRYVSCISPDVHWHCQGFKKVQCAVSEMMGNISGHGNMQFNQVGMGLLASLPDAEARLWRQEIIQRWGRIVNDYSSRKFTYPSDRVAAIAGAINYKHRLLNDDEDEPILGLWRKSFTNGLAWMRRPSSQNLSSGRSDSVHNLPSWTWLACAVQALYGSTRGRWEPGKRESDSFKHHVTVVNHRIEWTSAPYTSPLLYAYAHVECPPIREVELTPIPPENNVNRPWLQVFNAEPRYYSPFRPKNPVIPWRCTGQFDAGAITQGGGYPCMLIKSINWASELQHDNGTSIDEDQRKSYELFLILEKVEYDGTHDFGGLVSREENHDEILVYRRIGIAHLQSEEGQEVFDTAREKRISVILV